MPAPKDPAACEFYVYRFEIHRIPFYVGVGRSKRASDRERHVRRMMEREDLGLKVRWQLSSATHALAIRRQLVVKVKYVLKDVCRADALEREKREIKRLLRKGLALANLHHNPDRPTDAASLLSAVGLAMAASE
jgi:hypothetical protein